MLYYIYIGNSQTAIDHLSKVTNGMFVTVSGARKAAKIIDGIRERYNTSILYEQTDTEKDCLDITCLHKRFPRVYIILITEGLPAEARKAYLQAGVNNTLPPQADETSIHRMTQFLQVRQKHKMQEFSQSHRKMLNTFHLPAWKRAFDILFAICALIILSPLLIGTAIAIRLESKGKVIYKSQRVGSNYRIFNFLKFRSMYTNADKKLKELNALNQYKMEEEAADDTPDIRFDDLTGSSDEEANLLISDDFIIPEKDFFRQKALDFFRFFGNSCYFVLVFEFFAKPWVSRQIQTEFRPAFVYDKGSPQILWRFRKDEYQMQKVSKEYLLLFNSITDAEESLRRLQARLIDAQQKAEELFITDDEADPLSRNI